MSGPAPSTASTPQQQQNHQQNQLIAQQPVNNAPQSATTIATSTSTVLTQLKPIRFVNNEGQPPPKRRRINAACRTCRKRKTRCDGRRPLCSTCIDNGHECSGYADPSEGVVKREKRDANGMSRGNVNEDEEHDEEEERKYNPNVQERSNDRAQYGGTKHTFVHEDMHHSNRKSQSYFSPNAPMDKEGNMRYGEKQARSGYQGYRENAVFSDESRSSRDRSPPLHDSHRVPYFRYFGPTAIVPGFKQMVVSVREHRRSTGAGSSVAVSPGSGYGGVNGSMYGGTPTHHSERRSSAEMPIYDPNDPAPVDRLIIHLVETFFLHLGCNYPFLRKKTLVHRVEDKLTEPILVDAICALAARFSDHPFLHGTHDTSYHKSDYGHVFAQRAKAAVVDTFPCPTVAAVQACLLLAYEGFGASQDSALWMYLGCAIRMAVDLGLQKLDGVKHQGQKDPRYPRSSTDMTASDPPATISVEEKKEIEQERIDTLWAVFMLDRVISSGTGRPVTMRDEDFELSFPAVISNVENGWPNPFPALIQIIHLYGRVSDLLNNIRNVHDVTPKKIEGLSGMEKDLTLLYQRLDHRLTFNAANFQHYVKSGEGTNFILVHFWFHTLIMLLHQPTLMHTFEGQILQLLPNSRELSMSSAKTIADILAFAELIDPRSFIGNPFTSQPMYIAACAFLMESAAHTSSQPTSRDASPPRQFRGNYNKTSDPKANDQKQKHSLLASAANQNYQRCYKALQQLETYWAGTRYILVALDQKAKGIWDPETYTEQEYEMTKIKSDMIPGWRKKLTLAAASASASSPRFSDLKSPRMDGSNTIPNSPAIDASQAIGWSLTGTTNSPSSNLTLMYQTPNGDHAPPYPPPPPIPTPPPGNMIYDPIRSSLPEGTAAGTSTAGYSRFSYGRAQGQNMPPPANKYALSDGGASTSDAEMLLGLQGHSPFSSQSQSQHSPYDHTSNQQQNHLRGNFEFGNDHGHGNGGGNFGGGYGMGQGIGVGVGSVGGGEMMMQSTEIDVSTLVGDEMMPWLEYLPQDVLNFFDGGMGGGQHQQHHHQNQQQHIEHGQHGQHHGQHHQHQGGGGMGVGS